jgi:hypothetical protein
MRVGCHQHGSCYGIVMGEEGRGKKRLGLVRGLVDEEKDRGNA